MKIDGKYVLIGAVLVAALLVAASWKFFYSADVEAAKNVQNEINKRQTRLNELQEKSQSREKFEKGIADSTDITDTILSIYGPGNSPEKTIMTVVDMCKKTGCYVSNISFQDSRPVYENESPAVKIYKSGMSLNITCGYTQLKKIMDFINSFSVNDHFERMNVENFNVKFEANSGMLAVSMTVNMYSVADDKHEYKEPEIIEEIEIGSENIFKAPDPVPEQLYDENGNPIDEFGNIIELPEGMPSNGTTPGVPTTQTNN